MKDRTITRKLNTSRIKCGLKMSSKTEAQTEVRLTKINGIVLFNSLIYTTVYLSVGLYLHIGIYCS